MEREYIEKKKVLRMIDTLKPKHIAGVESFERTAMFTWVCGDMTQIILKMQPANVRAAKRGQWLCTRRQAICSNCNSVFGIEEACDFYYCPTCGAEMWLKEEDSLEDGEKRTP